MMLLCGLEELFAPEVGQPGVRFGNPYLEDGACWHGFAYAGQPVTATAGRASTHVRVGDLWEFYAEPGIIVRRFHLAEGAYRFTAKAPLPATIRFRFAGANVAAVCVNGVGQQAITRDGGELTFRIPAGESSVEINANVACTR